LRFATRFTAEDEEEGEMTNPRRCGFCEYSTADESEFDRHLYERHGFVGQGKQIPAPHANSRPAVLVRLYRGRTQEEAVRAFQVDATNLSALGYKPVGQQWMQGSWGVGAFIVALLLCLVIVGLFAFLYLLIVKPAGTLTVTYELREAAVPAGTQSRDVVS
jgi:hypothetical protein